MKGCLFCNISNKEERAEFVYEDDDIFAIKDIFPKAPIHTLIIPKQHIKTLNHLSKDNITLVGSMTVLAKQLAHDYKIDEGGYRLVWNTNANSGQSVWHIHLHLLGGRVMDWPPG